MLLFTSERSPRRRPDQFHSARSGNIQGTTSGSHGERRRVDTTLSSTPRRRIRIQMDPITRTTIKLTKTAMPRCRPARLRGLVSKVGIEGCLDGASPRTYVSEYAGVRGPCNFHYAALSVRDFFPPSSPSVGAIALQSSIELDLAIDTTIVLLFRSLRRKFYNPVLRLHRIDPTLRRQRL